jgi:hypothetical protein
MRHRLRCHLTFVMATLLAFTALGVGAVLASAPSAPALAKAPFFGRWQTIRTCSGLVQALRNANLRPLAPGVVGDYFPNQTPQQLARKRHLCRGAKPQRHSHFFTRDGLFGSLDQFGQQVDDGTYHIIGARTVHIGNPDVGARFHYQVRPADDGKVLALQPVITRRMRDDALAHPLDFSAAGWAVAVAYTPHKWKRVPCPWC